MIKNVFKKTKKGWEEVWCALTSSSTSAYQEDNSILTVNSELYLYYYLLIYWSYNIIQQNLFFPINLQVDCAFRRWNGHPLRRWRWLPDHTRVWQPEGVLQSVCSILAQSKRNSKWMVHFWQPVGQLACCIPHPWPNLLHMGEGVGESNDDFELCAQVKFFYLIIILISFGQPCAVKLRSCAPKCISLNS